MKPELEAATEELRGLLEANPATAGLRVRVRASQIVLSRCVEDVPGEPSEDDRVRLTPLGASRYGLSVRRHTGRWERTPLAGSLQEVVAAICTTLPHLVADG